MVLGPDSLDPQANKNKLNLSIITNIKMTPHRLINTNINNNNNSSINKILIISKAIRIVKFN